MHTRSTAAHDESGSPFWRLHREGHDVACEILVLPCGFESRFLMDGRFLYSYTFARPDQAITLAGQREVEYRRNGWAPSL